MKDQSEMTEELEKSLPFWGKLSETERGIILSNTYEKLFEKGYTVHKGDDSCLGVLVVKSGRLRTYLLSDEGREVTLFSLEKGDVCILSASCILAEITFDVCVDAEEDTEVLQINTMAFSQVNRSNIYAECFTYKETADRKSVV